MLRRLFAAFEEGSRIPRAESPEIIRSSPPLRSAWRLHHNVMTRAIMPGNARAILAVTQVPKNLALLKIDIDSLDCEVLRVLLETGYRPGVLILEVQLGSFLETAPFPLLWSLRRESGQMTSWSILEP